MHGTGPEISLRRHELADQYGEAWRFVIRYKRRTVCVGVYNGDYKYAAQHANHIAATIYAPLSSSTSSPQKA